MTENKTVQMQEDKMRELGLLDIIIVELSAPSASLLTAEKQAVQLIEEKEEMPSRPRDMGKVRSRPMWTQTTPA